MPSARARRGRFRPARLLGGLRQHRPQAVVVDVREPERHGVSAGRARERVHVHLAHVVVGRRREAAIRALAERRIRRVELHVLIRHDIWRLQSGRARVVVVELPRREPALCVDARAHIDHADRAEVAPHELFRARVNDLDRPARGLGEPRRFDRVLAGVLAAVRGSHVRHDHAHLVFAQMKRLRDFRADAERPLRAASTP